MAQESYALRHEANMLVLMISKKKKQLIPEFRYYEVLKEFHDQDNIVIIAGKKTYKVKTPKEYTT